MKSNMATLECTESCYAMPECTVCGMRKAPVGRSLPLEACNSYCDWDCRGYKQDPKPGHLWPSEREDLEYREE